MKYTERFPWNESKKIREIVSFGKENVTESAELHESVKTADKSDALYALIEAIHAGETRNDVSYMEQALKRAVGTWTENYNKPVLKDHRELADNQLGRVIKAEFIDTVTRPHTLLTAKITNPLAIDKINKGEYLTVSIGSEAKKALCSICGVDVIHEWSKCPHWRGEYYDEEGGRTTKEKGGRKCVYEIHELSHDEVSFVSTPADADAKVVKTATSLDKLKEGNVTKNDILNEIKAVEDSDKESSLKAKEVTELKYKALKAGIDLSEQSDAVKETKEDVIPEITDITANEKYEKLEALYNELVAKHEDITAKYQACTETNKSLTEQVEFKNMQIVELERISASIDSFCKEKDIALKQSLNKEAELVSKLRQSMVDRTVDAGILTNRIFDREKAIKEYSNKDTSVLEYILNEFKTNIKSVVSESKVEVKNDTVTSVSESVQDNVVNEQNDAEPGFLQRPTLDIIKQAHEGNEEAIRIINAWKNL